MSSNPKLSRRNFLRAAGVAAVGAAVGACAPAATPAPADTEPGSEAPAAEEITLIVSSWWNMPFKELASKFKETYPNITMEFIDADFGAHHDKLMTALVSGTGAPDIGGIEDSRISLFADTGGLADLSNYLSPYMDKIVEYKLKMGMYQGKYYSVPWDGSPCLLYYRRDVCEQYEIDPSAISTYEDWYNVGVALNEKSDGAVRLWGLGVDSSFPLINWCWQQGGGLYTQDESKVIIDNEIGVNTLTFIKKLWDDGAVHQNLTWDAQIASYKDGTSPIFTGAIWLAATIEGSAPETVGQWGVYKVPAWAAGGSRAMTWGGSQLAIPAQGKNIESAFRFLEFTQLSKEGSEFNWTAGSLFPVLKDAVNWDIMNEPVEFYGGEPALKLYAEVNSEVLPYYYGKGYLESTTIIGQQQAECLQGRKTPEQALTDAANEIREKQKLG